MYLLVMKVARAAFGVAVSEACQMSTSPRVTLMGSSPLDKQTAAVIHHTTGLCVWPCI